jgi:NADPH:quinone reductase-like Zn-dependent oxidoreductase
MTDARPTGQTATPAPTMRAVTQTAYGSADVLRPGVVDRPTIGPEEVLVRVHAAGLDRGVWHLTTGRPYLMRVAGVGFRRPRNLVAGLDVAGTVAAVGAGVTRFAVGDEVFGISRGSFAEFAAARADKLALKPAGLGFEAAAATAISGLTALQSLTDVGHLQAGQRVLIIGASGGVGTFAVQLAKALGAEVTGVCGPAKADLVRALGADHVLDYTTDDATSGERRYDLILDINGNTRLARLRRALTPTGTLVIVGGEGGGPWTGGIGRQLRAAALSPFVRQRLTMKIPKEHHADLERLARYIEAGDLTPAVDRSYPLEQVPAALRQLEAGQVRGKLVVTVAID